jgi:rifampicin phosphotransferase
MRVAALLDLDEPAARDPSVVGAKAAGLARARAAGLPALPGVVVPAALGSRAAAAALAALADAGSGGARLHVMACGLDEPVASELDAALRRLGPPVVVRSSSRLESAGVWSGAFSSYEGIGPEDVRTAVRGVWASAFTPDALRRCDETGTAV